MANKFPPMPLQSPMIESIRQPYCSRAWQSYLRGVTEAVENPEHDLVSSTHTASGLTPGHFLKALTATTFGFAAHGLDYDDVGAAAAVHTHSYLAGAGTAGYLPKYSGSLSLANSLLYESSDNLALHTTTPKTIHGGLTILTDPDAPTSAGFCGSLWCGMGAVTDGGGGWYSSNPASGDTCCGYFYASADAARPRVWTLNLCAANFVASGHVYAAELNLDNEGADNATPFGSAHCTVLGLVTGNSTYPSSAALAMTTARSTGGFHYGAWINGAKDAAVKVARLSPFGVTHDPTVSFDDDTNSGTWLRTTGTHATKYIDAPNFSVDGSGNVVCAGLTLSGGAVSYGANDSAGAGYRLVRVPNA